MRIALSDGQEPQIDANEFLDISKDLVHARVLKDSLSVLAKDDSNRTLQEMAREVLGGRIDLRDATAMTSYSDALIESMTGFREKWEAMSDADRQRLAEEGADAVRQREDMHQEVTARHGNVVGSRVSERHSGKGWSLY